MDSLPARQKKTTLPMELNLLTIAKRAVLGSRIENLTNKTIKRIEEAVNLNSKIESLDDISVEQKKYNRELTFIGIVSLLEQYLNFIHIDILECFPSKISKKLLDVDLILEEGSIMGVLSKKAQEKVTDLAYGKFSSLTNILQKNLELTGSLSDELINQINEIKCTRDVYAHTDGKCNSIYLQKTNDDARVHSIGNELSIDKPYFNESSQAISKFISDMYALIPDKFKKTNKKYILKQMWEATCLNNRIPFETAWIMEEHSDMARPNDFETTYGFSHSEVQIYYFFLDIYCDEKRVDYKYLFSRWKPSSNEYQVVQSWLDSPFYF